MLSSGQQTICYIHIFIYVYKIIISASMNKYIYIYKDVYKSICVCVCECLYVYDVDGWAHATIWTARHTYILMENIQHKQNTHIHTRIYVYIFSSIYGTNKERGDRIPRIYIYLIKQLHGPTNRLPLGWPLHRANRVLFGSHSILISVR